MNQEVLQKIGKYEILSELGSGGMGVVYLARDPFIGRKVALKTIMPELVTNPEVLKRFYREAQSAGTLQHRNIVTIYDMGEAERRPYIAMELVEGESLQGIINLQARIPLAAKLKLVEQVCEGLGYAHKHGVVHRDVKPANILVTNDGVVKLVDFGIAHLESNSLTRTGKFLGTIHYASPEQINDGRVDNRSDLWAVGAVIYEFIAYRKAFEGSNIAATIAKILSADPEPLSVCCPGVPSELDHIISKGLAKKPSDRYSSLDEMLDDVQPIARRLQQSLISELIVEAKALRDQGDLNAARQKVRATLILDHTHVEANRLLHEIQAATERQASGSALQSVVDNSAQSRVKADTAPLAAGSSDASLQDQERARTVREAVTAGQQAVKRGDLTGAEQVLQRALQLDSNNPQAVEILEQIRKDRQGRERDFLLKESLWYVDKLVAAGKYLEARDRLQALQQEFAGSDEIRLKLEILEPFVKAASLVEDGRRAMSQGEYGEAARALSAALELNPRDQQAAELKAAAVKERDRLRLVREALSAGQKAMREGDSQTAAIELRKVLDLDPSHAEGTSLMSQIGSSKASEDREAKLREGMKRAGSFLAEKKFDEAQYALLELQHDFPEATVVAEKLQELQPKMKLHSLIIDGEQALQQGEFGEAVRILTGAQQLAPNDEYVRKLRVRAVQERDRLRQVREAISGGQRALRQGELEIAEKQLERALQLEPENTQATSLLAEVKTERRKHEKDEALRSGVKRGEELIAAKKFDEAQSQLEDLLKDHPDAKPLQALAESLKQKRAVAAAIQRAQPPAAAPPEKRPAVQPAPASEYSRSMDLAEELRRSLQKLKSLPAARPNVRPSSTLEPGPLPAASPKPPVRPSAPPVGEGSDATLVRGAAPAKPATPAKPAEPNATVASTPKLISAATEKKDQRAESNQPETKPGEA